MSATHNPTVITNLFFTPSPVARASFGTMLRLVPLADNPLGGSGSTEVLSIGSLSEATASATAGDISAATLATIQAIYQQSRVPSRVKVASVDLVGGQTYAEAIEAADAIDSDFYGVTMDSRDATEQVAVSQAVEALNRLFIMQSSDADWLTADIPAAYAAIENFERTAVVYHDTDTVPCEAAWMAKRLTFDPDVRASAWMSTLNGIASLAAGLTTAQADFGIQNEATLPLPKGGFPIHMSRGNNLASRQIHQVIGADWFRARVNERLTDMMLTLDERGLFIPMAIAGQQLVLNHLTEQLRLGVEFGHFSRGQVAAAALDISSEDRALKRLRFKVDAKSNGAAVIVATDATMHTLDFQ